MAVASTSLVPLRALASSSPLGPSKTFGKRISRDTAYDPFTHRYNYLKDDPNNLSMDFIGYLIPANDMVPRESLYAAALTPKGRFITWVAVQNAFRFGWFFIQTKLDKEPISSRLEKRLWELNYEYNLKDSFIQANFLRRIFGQCLWFVRETAPLGSKSRFMIHVTPIWREDIEYDGQGNVTMYHPRLYIGNLYMRYDIKPNRAVLWKNGDDPFGNLEQGISELIAVYRTILRSESIAQNFAQIVTQRGLGQLDIEIEGINNEDDAKRWADLYKGLVQDSIVVHSPDMKTQITPGINAGYDYDATQQAYYEDTAAGTGFPQMRMRGVQTGTVTGSETDQDNMAEIYGNIQESSEKFMKQCYVILDPTLAGTRPFEIDWKIDLKADEQKITNMLATNVQTVLTGSKMIKVNQALKICGLPLLLGPEGEMFLEEWIDTNFPDQMPGDIRTKGSIGYRGEAEPLEESSAEEEPEEEPAEKPAAENVSKDSVARAIFEKIHDAGVRPVNNILKALFNEGLSHTRLVSIRDSKRQ